MENKTDREAMEICQIFTEGEILFGCLEPIKYIIAFEGLDGTTAASCQTHYELYKSDVESKGLSDFIKFYEINDGTSDNKSKEANEI